MTESVMGERGATGGVLAAQQSDAIPADQRRGRLLAARARAQPSLSIVVPATARRETLVRYLAAIDVARGPDDEVIVVRQAAVPGPASARNNGAGTATNSILVFVDADVEIRGDALGVIRRHFDEDQALAAVFGSYDDDPEEWGVVPIFRNLLHHSVHRECAGDVDSFWAGLGAVRREAFERVGGFDASIVRASVEDIELGSRLCSTVLCVMNRCFYRLLAARGRRYVVLGVALHVIHHLTSVLALALGTLDVTRRQSRRRQSSADRGS